VKADQTDPTSLAGIIAAAAVCAGAALGVLLLAALAVSLTGLAPETRGLLGFGFGGVERSPLEVARLAIHNGRVAGGTLLCAAVAPSLRPPVRRVVDVMLAALLVFNTAAVGVAIGAYGTRGIVATAPHTPVEFSALSLAGGAYTRACRHPLGGRALSAVATATGVLVVAAAALETYASLGGAQ
jgi:hypothetical protein